MNGYIFSSYFFGQNMVIFLVGYILVGYIFSSYIICQSMVIFLVGYIFSSHIFGQNMVIILDVILSELYFPRPSLGVFNQLVKLFALQQHRIHT